MNLFDYKNKEKNIEMMNSYLLTKTLSMFEYQNLPETIPPIELEKILQTKGVGYFTEHKGKHYIFNGSMSGEQGVYGEYTKFLVNNTYLKLNQEFDIEKDGVLMLNDSLSLGLIPFFNKHNTMLAENELSMLIWSYNSRTQSLITAEDDKSRTSAEEYINKIIKGDLSVIGTNALFDGVKLQDKTNDIGVTNFIELQQYIKSSLFNEIGLSSNFNMKKERLISAEVSQSEDSIFAFVYNMMQNRTESLNKINEKYGLNIQIDFGSVWTFKDKKLTDGVIDNDHEITELDNTDIQDSQTGVLELEENGGTERDPERDPEKVIENESDSLPEKLEEEIPTGDDEELERDIDLAPEPETETEPTYEVEEVEEVEPKKEDDI